jgi:hypothetical protein
MHFRGHHQAAAASALDRRIIQVQLPSDSAGVIEALRRAFEPALACPNESDFDALLRRLGDRSL